MGEMEAYKSILIVPHSERQGLYPSIAEALKKRYGSRLTLLCKSREEKQFYEDRYPGLFVACYSYRFYTAIFDPVVDREKLIDESRRIEQSYGLLFSRLFADDRHLGLGFSPGGINFPRSVFSAASNYWSALNAFVRQIEYLEVLIDLHEITMVVNPSKSLAQLAKGKGIPVRIFTSSRYENYYYWAVNDVLESNLMAKAFSMLRESECEEACLTPPPYYVRNRQNALKTFRLSRTVYEIGYQLARRAWYRYKKYEKAKGYLLKENIKIRLRRYSQAREVRRLFTATLDDLKGRDFIYFPLGVEPERSLTRDSPEFSHQGFALQTIAQNSPAGVLIAVKEHITGIGPRPEDFYKSLSMLPNVVLVDVMESSLELIKNCKAVATVTGTAGLEAAFMGVPVLSFGRYNIYNIVPHVYTLRSWLDMENQIYNIMDSWENRLEERKKDGSRFLQAVKNISVNCGKTDFQRYIHADSLDSIIALLHESLTNGDE